jgi:hypothetical protein
MNKTLVVLGLLSLILAALVQVSQQQAQEITATPEGTPLETNMPLRVDGQGCPTLNTLACSGHGKCVPSKASFWGNKEGSGKKQKSEKRCFCHKGWYGTACQMTLSDYADLLQLHKALEAVTNNVPLAVESSAPPQPPIPDVSFMRKLDDDSTPRVPKTLWIPPRSDRAADEPGDTKLDDWTSPPASAIDPGAEMVAKFEKERTVITLPAKAPAKRELFDSESSHTRMALYTSDAGDSLIAPTIYPGQAGFQMVAANAVKREDPTVQKLIATLNQAYKSPPQ